jgi:hypothetical protein
MSRYNVSVDEKVRNTTVKICVSHLQGRESISLSDRPRACVEDDSIKAFDMVVGDEEELKKKKQTTTD